MEAPKYAWDESHQPWNNGEGGPLMCGRCGAESGSLKGSRRCPVELAEMMARSEARPPIGPPPGASAREAAATVLRRAALLLDALGQTDASLAIGRVSEEIRCGTGPGMMGDFVTPIEQAIAAEAREVLARHIEQAARMVDDHFEFYGTPELRWQPIETAPKDGTSILAFDDEWEEPVVLRWLQRWHSQSAVFGWCDNSGDMEQGYAPTHWMPLPEPPK